MASVSTIPPFGGSALPASNTTNQDARFFTSPVFEFGGTFRKTQMEDDTIQTPPWNRYYGGCVLPGIVKSQSIQSSVASGESRDWVKTPGLRAVVFGGFQGTSDTFLYKTQIASVPVGNSSWVTLGIKKPVVESEEASAKSAPPSPRVLPLMIGLSKNKFLVLGGKSPNPPYEMCNDAFVGEIIGDAEIKWQPVFGSYDPTSAPAAFRFPNDDDVFTASIATFMRADDGTIIALAPKTVKATREPSVYDVNDGSLITGETPQTLGVIFFNFQETGVFADYYEVQIPKTKSQTGGFDGWPSTELHSVKMAPLCPGYAFGIQVPRSQEAARLCHPQTWLLSVFKTAIPTTTAIGGYEPDGSFTKRTIPYRFQFSNLGSLPNAPPLASEALVFSTGARMQENARDCVVAVYGGHVWNAPAGDPKTGTVSPNVSRLFVGTFFSGTDGKTPKFAWLPEFEREIIKTGSAPGYSIPDAGVPAVEIEFDPRDWGVSRNFASVFSKTYGFNFVFYGGTGRRDAPPATVQITFLVRKELIRNPSASTEPKEWSGNYPSGLIGTFYKRINTGIARLTGNSVNEVANVGNTAHGVYPSLHVKA